MSKITFRADDDLVEQLEALDASKSEAMRDALRSYLEEDGTGNDETNSGLDRDRESEIEKLVRELVDERLAEQLRGTALGPERANAGGRDAVSSPEPQDVNVTVSLEGAAVRSAERAESSRVSAGESADGDRPAARPRDQTGTQIRDREGDRQCNQCGDHLSGNHVYCPNCGEKASRRLFCDCGDEIRSDWSFCPGCGRRTPAADVLESDGTQY
ncbi:ribbon-helix-helix protein, CopG family [Natrinema caseinilyticum]|uniref:ribbon-helix-helix protein, CopG family n=1 Tax=Natrinema caseinilyticum TaxID=2961570 RepID=UPI0020C431E4|nr:ribbon-helix-helix protein, CopG family [Natrinema caseinilyticum]